MIAYININTSIQRGQNMKTMERVIGSLYGMATGDALGVPSSFMTQKYIEEKWGWIDRYILSAGKRAYFS